MTDPLTVEISAQAAAQIRAAEAWWQKHRPKAPDALRLDLEHALTLLASQPRIGAIARNASLPHVRRLHMARVHYHLYYRQVPATSRLQILALWHTSRGDAPKL